MLIGETMTEFIIGKRCSGKTTELIKRSSEIGAVIVTSTTAMADCIRDQAIYMHINIPKPMSITLFQHVMDGKNDNQKLRTYIQQNGILIDELDLLLHSLFRGVNVNSITITDRDDIGNIKFLEVKETE